MNSASGRARIFQRPWTWWFTLIVLALVAAVRLRLLNFPLERDEGEYAYSGQLMLQGIPPYQLAYNMKFPGTYAAYAVIMALFGETPAGIHLGILLMTTATALMLFWFGKKILDETAGTVAATSYAVLAASPSMLGLSGHATHFAGFFVTIGICLMWRARQNIHWLWSFAFGICFGMAVLMKQHAVVIGAWAGIAFAVTCLLKKEQPLGTRILSVVICAIGMFLPFALCCLILWRAGVFHEFWFWTIDYARQYASVVPISYAPELFWHGFRKTFEHEFLLWIAAIAGLGLLWVDGRLKSQRAWLLGFGVASALAFCPDFYFRKHYFLLAIPAAGLLAGVAVSALQKLFEQKGSAVSLPRWTFAIFLAVTTVANARAWFIEPNQRLAREIYGADPLPEAPVVADFIKRNSTPDTRFAILGSEPEIYFLAHRHSDTGYIYVYGMMEPQPFAGQMQNEMISDIETRKPEFIVFADNIMSWNRRPDSKRKIFDWWDSYKTNYTLVGLADILSPTQTVYALGSEFVKRYGGQIHGSGLEIYQSLNATNRL